MKSLAIIGCGFSGSCLAFLLKNHFKIHLFDKAKGVGGRLSVRYTDEFCFDFGAPYFEASHPDFLNFIQKNLPVAQMDDKWVSFPKMNSMVKKLVENVNLSLSTRITKLDYNDSQWLLYQDDLFLGRFDYCVLAIPPEQAEALIGKKFNLEKYSLESQFVMMLGGSDLSLSSENVINHPWIERIIPNHLKPHRSTKPSWVIYMSTEWSKRHLENDLENVENLILNILQNDFEVNLAKITYKSLHRWRYAINTSKHTTQTIWHSSMHLGVIGDFLLQGTVESAYLSAKAMSDILFQEDKP